MTVVVVANYDDSDDGVDDVSSTLKSCPYLQENPGWLLYTPCVKGRLSCRGEEPRLAAMFRSL